MPAPQVDLALTVTYGSADEAVVRLDEGTTAQRDLERQLADLVETRPTRVTLDLGALPRVSSAHLGVLLALRRGVVNYAGEVRVAGVSAKTSELFRETGLNLLFEVEAGSAVVH